MKKFLKPIILLGCIGTIVSCTKKEEGVTPDPVVSNAEAAFVANLGER